MVDLLWSMAAWSDWSSNLTEIARNFFLFSFVFLCEMKPFIDFFLPYGGGGKKNIKNEFKNQNLFRKEFLTMKGFILHRKTKEKISSDLREIHSRPPCSTEDPPLEHCLGGLQCNKLKPETLIEYPAR